MKKLIVVRHGAYNLDGTLTEGGGQQIEMLGQKLRNVCGRSSVRILTSPTLRTRQTAEILSGYLEAPIQVDTALQPPDMKTLDSDMVLDWVRSKENVADVLVMVTHSELVGTIPYSYALETWQFQWGIPRVEMGGALLVDCEKKILVKVE